MMRDNARYIEPTAMDKTKHGGFVCAPSPIAIPAMIFSDQDAA
jgi:hypothetical protein